MKSRLVAFKALLLTLLQQDQHLIDVPTYESSLNRIAIGKQHGNFCNSQNTDRTVVKRCILFLAVVALSSFFDNTVSAIAQSKDETISYIKDRCIGGDTNQKDSVLSKGVSINFSSTHAGVLLEYETYSRSPVPRRLKKGEPIPVTYTKFLIFDNERSILFGPDTSYQASVLHGSVSIRCDSKESRCVNGQTTTTYDPSNGISPTVKADPRRNAVLYCRHPERVVKAIKHLIEIYKSEDKDPFK